MIGRTLSHYQILQELDSSGMGVVYRHLLRHCVHYRRQSHSKHLVAFGDANDGLARSSLAQVAVPQKPVVLLVKRGPNSACSLTNLPQRGGLNRFHAPLPF